MVISVTQKRGKKGRGREKYREIRLLKNHFGFRESNQPKKLSSYATIWDKEMGKTKILAFAEIVLILRTLNIS